MLRISRLRSSAVLPLILLGASSCWGQNRPKTDDPLMGTWTLTSISATRPDGSKEQPFDRGEGLLMFDATGRFAVLFCKPDRPKFVSNNRLKGTPDEYRATAEGCNNYWGRYMVDPNSRTLSLAIENATFPNLIGQKQVRPFTITADELQITSPGAAGGTAVSRWERAK